MRLQMRIPTTFYW